MRELWEIPFEQTFAMDKREEYNTPPWEGKSDWKKPIEKPTNNPKPKFKKVKANKKHKQKPKYFNPNIPPTEFKIPLIEHKKIERVSCDTCKRQIAPLNHCVCRYYS